MRECEFDKAFELAGQIRRLGRNRTNCPMPADFLAVAMGKKQWTEDELKHLEECSRCQKVSEDTRAALGG